MKRKRRSNKQAKPSFVGRRFVPAADPPSVTLRPWYAQCVVIEGQGEKVFKDEDIRQAILAQNGIAEDTNNVVQYRAQQVRVYQEVAVSGQLPSPLNNPLVVHIKSIIGEGVVSLQGDYSGSEVRYARVGYRWSLQDRAATLCNLSQDVILALTPRNKSAHWVVYLDLLWNCAKPQLITMGRQADAFELLA